MNPGDPIFPHPVYARYVLSGGFAESKRLLYPYMMQANDAHVLMLHATGILDEQHTVALLRALQRVKERGPDVFTYHPEVEDLFFLIEGDLIEQAGADAGGNLQIARSRNDLDAVMCHLLVRDRLLDIERLVLDLRRVLIDLIRQHIDTVMPGITHTQPAQPTTLAHYLLGVLGPLERDSQRLRAVSVRNNRSSLGAAAFTTTSFPIDRELTAALLGFDGVIVNGYDAVGGADHMVEATQVLATMASGLARFVNDLLIWARFEAGILRVHQSFAQISSIMPQKRNPVVFEHIRARTGYVLGDANTVLTMVHSAAFGDTVDVEDPIYVPLARTFDSAEAVVALLNAALPLAEINTDVLAARATVGNSSATAVADGLVRDYGLPFRTAHEITSKSVRQASARNEQISLADVISASATVLGSPIDLDQAWLSDRLDARVFVAERSVMGGPAPTAVRAALIAAEQQLQTDRDAIEIFAQHIAAAVQDRTQRIAALIGQPAI